MPRTKDPKIQKSVRVGLLTLKQPFQTVKPIFYKFSVGFYNGLKTDPVAKLSFSKIWHGDGLLTPSTETSWITNHNKLEYMPSMGLTR
jgi:hypothetical protein